MLSEETEKQPLTAAWHLNHTQNKWHLCAAQSEAFCVTERACVCLDTAEGALTLRIYRSVVTKTLYSPFVEVHRPANTQHYQNFACFLHGWFLHIVSRIEELPQFMINALGFTSPGYLWFKDVSSSRSGLCMYT